jgi:hypothetical protein
VQVGLSPFDDRVLRGGVVERCAGEGIMLIAHSPLGGPKRVGRLARNEALAEAAEAVGAAPAEATLAWLLGLSPVMVAIPGARRPETARSAAAAARLELDHDEHERVGRARGRGAPVPPTRAAAGADVVIVMGIPGAGKTAVAEELEGAGYVRLNRDARGGSLRDVAAALEHALGQGVRRVVLDNTYLTRAAAAMWSRPPPVTARRCAASGSTRRSRRRRSTSWSACSTAWARCRSPTRCEVWPAPIRG